VSSLSNSFNNDAILDNEEHSLLIHFFQFHAKASFVTFYLNTEFSSEGHTSWKSPLHLSAAPGLDSISSTGAPLEATSNCCPWAGYHPSATPWRPRAGKVSRVK